MAQDRYSSGKRAVPEAWAVLAGIYKYAMQEGIPATVLWHLASSDSSHIAIQFCSANSFLKLNQEHDNGTGSKRQDHRM